MLAKVGWTVGGICVVVSAVFGALYTGGWEPFSSSEANMAPSSGGHALVGRATLSDMIRTADLIFVGTASATGASVPIVELPNGQSLTAHPVKLNVQRVFRGQPGDEATLMLLDADETAYAFQEGQRYLIFARWTELGDARIRSLVPVGYAQGIYRVSDAGIAHNDVNGDVDLNTFKPKGGASS